MSLERLLPVVQRDLDESGASWAVVGGIAVGARTEPRFTADLDLAVVVDDDGAAEVLLRNLLAKGYQLVALVEQTATGRLATARLRPEGFEPVVDLLFASSGIEAEVVREAAPLEVFPGAYAPVASIPHLVAMKLLARDDSSRDQDRGDLRKLLQRASGAELQRVRELLRLIRARGYDRGRNLEEALTQAGEEFGPRS